MAINGIGHNHGDEYYTPKEVVDYFGKFDYDPATTKTNAKRLNIDNYDTITTDGLKRNWEHFDRIWVNPPFSDKASFLRKAKMTFEESKNDIFILFPIGYLTTKEFQKINISGELFVPNYRINFIFGDEGIKKSPSMGSVILKVGYENKITYLSKGQIYDTRLRKAGS